MSSSYSANSARTGELPEKNELIRNYSGDSESVVGASSSRESIRGQEETSTSGQEDRGKSPLAELFHYPTPVSRQSRETRRIVSPTRAPRVDTQEGVGTSRPSQFVERRQVIEVPHLRDESPSPAEPSFRVKSEECNWAFNPLVEKERLEAWIASGAAELVKKKRSRRKQRPPPGSSWSDEESLGILRKECGIPEDVEMLAPTLEQREDAPPVGTFTAYECWFRDCYLTFPIPALILRYMWTHKIALAQINSRGVRQLVGILTRAAECGESIGFRHLFNLLDFRAQNNPSNKKLYNLASRPLYKVIDDFPNKDHNWRKSFFFVRISAASVELENPRLAKWGTLGRFLYGLPRELFLCYFSLIRFTTRFCS